MNDVLATGQWAQLREIYGARARSALVDSIIPFWWRSVDEARGGVFNCWNNAGTHLVSRDKFTWSQARFAWLWSRLADLCVHGEIVGNASAFQAHAAKTVGFLRAHAFLPDGRCAFLLSEDGEVKEAIPGRGPAPSIYADCFVVMGCAEFARVSGQREMLDVAWRLFEDIERRVALGGFPTHPEPTPKGFEAHGIVMILLNLTLVLVDACERLNDRRLASARARSIARAEKIFERFLRPGGRIAEMRSDKGDDDDSL